MKDYNKNKESSCLKYWDINNLYGWTISQKWSVSDFIWAENRSKFNENFMKSYNEDNDIGYFLEDDVQHPEKIAWTLQWFTIFIWKDENCKGWKACSPIA